MQDENKATPAEQEINKADPAEQDNEELSVDELKSKLKKLEAIAKDKTKAWEKTKAELEQLKNKTGESEDEKLTKTVQELKDKIEARELDEAFNTVAMKVLEDNPEFKDIVDLEVIKRLHADSDKTVEEIIKTTYGKFVSSERRGFEKTKGTTVETETSFAGTPGSEIKEAIKDPHTKKAYEKDLLNRMRKSF